MRRLDQLLSNLGYCSRRDVRDWLRDERITIKGEIADDHSAKVNPSEVLVDGQALEFPEGMLLMLNKPLGLVCSHDEREGPNIYSILPQRWRDRNPTVTSIGRLDKDTSGLLLITDLSALVHRLTSPKHKVPKVYLATLDAAPGEARAAEMSAVFASGTLLLEEEDAPCAPATLCMRSPQLAELTLTEGRYHQVRRMFASQGFTVTALHRERFGNLTLGDLAPGKWRELPLNSFD